MTLGDQPLDVVLLYDDTSRVRRGLPVDELPDADQDTMRPVAAALEALGHRVRLSGVSYDDLGPLDSVEADVVFQVADGNGLDGNPGVEVPLALERRGVRFCGSGSSFYQRSTDKLAMKARLAAARIPVPLGTVLGHPDARLPAGLSYPLIVKPRDGFGSLGIHAGSVVRHAGQLRREVERLLGELDTDPLVAQYVPGRELTVGVIGQGARAFALPVLEVEFGEAYAGIPPIKTFQSKFDASSALYHDFVSRCPARLAASVVRRVQQVALRAYRAMGGDSYGRVDIRLAPNGTPYVIEVNAQPSLEAADDPHECATLPLIARGAGWSYPELLRHILGTAWSRPAPKPGAGPSLVARWHGGTTGVHATRPVAAGAVLRAIGDLRPVPELYATKRCLRLEDGRAVRVDVPLRHVEHSDDPALEIVARPHGERLRLVLQARRAIAAGEALTIDRTIPLPPAALRRRPRAHGRRAGHPGLHEPLSQVS